MISIVMPVYNTANFLENAIMSILNQTYKNWELIVVDDGSTDNSLKICNKMMDKYDNIYVFSQKNKGVAAARNYGIQKTRGKYVAFLDSDDSYESFFLEKLSSVAEKENANVVYCGLNYYREQKVVRQSEQLKKKGKIIAEYLELLADQKYPFHVCSILVSRSLLKDSQINFTEGITNGEDTTFLIKLFSKGCAAFVHENLFNYTFRRNGSATQDNMGKIAVSILKSFREAHEYLRVNYNDDDSAQINYLARKLIDREYRYWFNRSLREKNSEGFQELVLYYKNNKKILMDKSFRVFLLEFDFVVGFKFFKRLKIRI